MEVTNVMIEMEGAIAQYIVLIAYIVALLHWIHIYMSNYWCYGVLYISCMLLYCLYIGYLSMVLWLLQRLHSTILSCVFFLNGTNGLFDYTTNASARANGKFPTTITINLSNNCTNRLFDYGQAWLEAISLLEIDNHPVSSFCLAWSSLSLTQP